MKAFCRTTSIEFDVLMVPQSTVATFLALTRLPYGTLTEESVQMHHPEVEYHNFNHIPIVLVYLIEISIEISIHSIYSGMTVDIPTA
jgi:hypothetical protein